MGTRIENSVFVVIAGTPIPGESDLLRSAFDAAAKSVRLSDVFHVRDSTEWNSWIGETPAAFGQRNTALAFSVAAYRRSAEQADTNQQPIGVAVLCDSDTEITTIAVHSCEHTELYQTDHRRSSATDGSRDDIAEILRNAAEQSIVSAQVGLRSQPIALELAPKLLADVWHGRRPAVWSQRGSDWKPQSNVTPAGVLSGSFHPLHRGHKQLQLVAEQFLGGEVQFEMPIANAEKPSLDYLSIGERCRQFTESTLAVSNAPTFVEKVAVFKDVTFVVGADTAERIVDPRFYGGDLAAMERALSAIGSADCRFLVAGRQSAAGFQTIRDIDVPPAFRDLFVELPPAEFRMDVSSTQSRQNRR